MNAVSRVGTLVLATALATAAAAEAQIPGMPLFTNPRYGTGFRIHADAGTNLGDQKLTIGSAQVFQAGVTFALGPVGMGVNVGGAKNDFDAIQSCANGSITCDPETKVTGSALAQLRLVGGGTQNGALSVFGGISADFNGYDSPQLQAQCGGAFLAQATCDSLTAKIMTIPVGVSVGFKLGPLMVWGAPRYVMYRASECGPAAASFCNDRESEFRYAVGADLPLGILSIRAAYDGGKFQGTEVQRIGVGASIGIGGVR